ncbi:Protein ROOT INITIATION DEFECTIVE 3 [Escovopsis weberi]|uniref:Pre-rRNA-processing protein IPI3 n=1 Tax=Escovopsis weberi TaxID=150374 RepID=A0A0M9VUD2_ESCWE|nr:Protein ROOT INITIATION DEFECTIVE 3 [Escovopsis weberi]
MISEQVFSSVCGPSLAANTAISKDIGIYAHSLTPSWAVKSSFKKSSAPAHCLALSETHVFAAQDQKAHVHVYSRLRGNQEALISFQERIKCLTLIGDVLVLGTVEGRLILWEAVSCVAVSSHHILSASEDSNINVWSLAHLLEPGHDVGLEPDRTLSNHRAAITDLVLGHSTNLETNFCVSASRDKTCIIWNYLTGQVLRTLLFPTSPLCISLDPCARALFACAEDGSLFLVDFFGDKPLLGSRSAELASIVVQVNAPLGAADEDAGPASCLAVTYDGTSVLTGHTKGKVLKWSLADDSHPIELANLNALVSNLIMAPPLCEAARSQPVNIVKLNQAQRQYTLMTQLEGDLNGETRFSRMLGSEGLPADIMAEAVAAFAAPAPAAANDSSELQRQNDELREIIKEQQALQKATLEQYARAEKKL